MPQEIPSAKITEFLSFSPERQLSILQKMPPELKDTFKSSVLQRKDILAKQSAKFPTKAEGGHPDETGFIGSSGLPIPSPDSSTPGNIVNALGRTAANLATLPYQITHAATHPVQDILTPMAKESDKSKEAYGQGRYSEAVGHGLASVFPMLGPWAAGLGERAGKGDVSGAVTEAATSLGVPHVIGHAAAGLDVGDLPRNLLQRAEDIRSRPPNKISGGLNPKTMAIRAGMNEISKRRPIAKTYEIAGEKLAGKNRPPLTKKELAAERERVAADESSRIRQAQSADLAKYPRTGFDAPSSEQFTAGTPGFIREQLERIREQETPEQLHEREKKMREAQVTAPREDFAETPKGGFERPQPPTHIDAPVSSTEGSALKSIEEKIGPRGDRAKQAVQMVDADGKPTKFGESLMRIVPELADAPKGPRADAALMGGYGQALQRVMHAEEAIDPATRIDVTPIVSDLGSLAAEYIEKGWDKSADAIQKLAMDWAGRDMSWGEFIKKKRGFFEEHNLRKAMYRRAYSALMKASNRVSPELAKANGEYSTVRRALDAGKIDVKTGRRISDVAKAEKAPVRQQMERRPINQPVATRAEAIERVRPQEPPEEEDFDIGDVPAAALPVPDF